MLVNGWAAAQPDCWLTSKKFWLHQNRHNFTQPLTVHHSCQSRCFKFRAIIMIQSLTNSEDFKKMYGTVPSGRLLLYTATLLYLHNHSLVIYLNQGGGQSDPGALQLRRRFWDSKRKLRNRSKCGTYTPPTLGTKGPQQLSPGWPVGKIKYIAQKQP